MGLGVTPDFKTLAGQFPKLVPLQQGKTGHPGRLSGPVVHGSYVGTDHEDGRGETKPGQHRYAIHKSVSIAVIKGQYDGSGRKFTPGAPLPAQGTQGNDREPSASQKRHLPEELLPRNGDRRAALVDGVVSQNGYDGHGVPGKLADCPGFSMASTPFQPGLYLAGFKQRLWCI
jgi:hypothetical protein